MARSKKVSHPVLVLRATNHIAARLRELNVGQAVKLNGLPSKPVAKHLRNAGATLSATENHVRTVTFEGKSYEWRNVTFIQAQKHNLEAGRTITRTK